MKKLLMGVVLMGAAMGVYAKGSTVALSCPTYGNVIHSMDDGMNSLSTDKETFPVSKGTLRFVDQGEIVTVQMSAKSKDDTKAEQMAGVMVKVSDALKGYMSVVLPYKHAEMCKITDRQSY